MDKSIIQEKTQGVEKPEGLCQAIIEAFSLETVNPTQYSPLTLAFIGDGIYDLIIRTIILERGNAPVNKLHKRVSSLVKAASQAELFYAIEEYLTEEEMAVYKRGRNAKSFTSAKNASMADYRKATGVEALMGFLYLTGQTSRALELVKIGLQEKL